MSLLCLAKKTNLLDNHSKLTGVVVYSDRANPHNSCLFRIILDVFVAKLASAAADMLSPVFGSKMNCFEFQQLHPLV